MRTRISDLDDEEKDALLFCKECNDIVEQVIVDFDIYECIHGHLNFAPVDGRPMTSATNWFKNNDLGKKKIEQYKRKKLQGE